MQCIKLSKIKGTNRGGAGNMNFPSVFAMSTHFTLSF